MAKVEFSNSTALSSSDTLMIFIFFALIIHSVLILGVNFSQPKVEKSSKSIEITLVTNKSKKPPKKAEFLAQNNQLAAGEKQDKPTPAAQKIASSGTQANKPPRPKVIKRKSIARKQQVITQKVAEKSVEITPKTTKTVEKSKPKLSMNALYAQASELGAQISYKKPSSKKNRIKFVNTVSAHKYLATQYITDWQRKIEGMGNLNYPAVAKRDGFNSTLTMDVAINADGSIYNLRINKSSGYSALDDAAKRIVRLSAPFPPLPKELLQELDILVITRVWKFSDETGFGGR
ncbi:MAG: TonB family protein [Methyloprofundus sp.]|nr:TonB family protein [Methyloprofundus sp.]